MLWYFILFFIHSSDFIKCLKNLYHFLFLSMVFIFYNIIKSSQRSSSCFLTLQLLVCQHHAPNLSHFISHKGAFVLLLKSSKTSYNNSTPSMSCNLSVKCDIVHLKLIMSARPAPPRRRVCRGCCPTLPLLWSCVRDKPGTILFV